MFAVLKKVVLLHRNSQAETLSESDKVPDLQAKRYNLFHGFGLYACPHLSCSRGSIGISPAVKIPVCRIGFLAEIEIYSETRPALCVNQFINSRVVIENMRIPTRPVQALFSLSGHVVQLLFIDFFTNAPKSR